MKISVSPISPINTIERYIASEKLNRVYSEYEKKTSEKKMKAIKRIFVPRNDQNRLRHKVVHSFYEIGYKTSRCDSDSPKDIRFQNYLMGSRAKDLVFHSLEEAKNWLVGADAWKE